MLDAIHDHLHFNTEVSEIIASRFFRSFGLSLVSIFIPLFFLKQGFSLWSILIEYYAVYSLTLVAANFGATRFLVRRIGIKHTIILYLPFVVTQMLLLNMYESFPVHPSIIAALAGSATAFYWLGIHVDFAMTSQDWDHGRESGFFFAASRAAKTAAPLLGGIIIVTFGFPILFLTAIGVLLLSVVPLFLTEDFLEPQPDDWMSFFQRDNLKYIARFFVQGLKGTVDKILWPMFIFLTLGSYIDVGLAGTLAIIGSSVFSIALGKVSDEIGSTELLVYTPIPLALVYFAMPFATTELAILGLAISVGVFAMGVKVPIYRSFLRHAGRRDAIGYTLFRELLLHTGRLTGLALTILLAGNFLANPGAIAPVFYIIGLSVLTLMIPGL